MQFLANFCICLLVCLLGLVLLGSISWGLRVSRSLLICVGASCWFRITLFKEFKSLFVFLWILKWGVDETPSLGMLTLTLLGYILWILKTILWNMLLRTIQWIPMRPVSSSFHIQLLPQLLIWNLERLLISFQSRSLHRWLSRLCYTHLLILFRLVIREWGESLGRMVGYLVWAFDCFVLVNF